MNRLIEEGGKLEDIINGLTGAGEEKVTKKTRSADVCNDHNSSCMSDIFIWNIVIRGFANDPCDLK